MERENPSARDCLHPRRTTEQHVPEVDIQRRRTALLSHQECQPYPRQCQHQQVPGADFQEELSGESRIRISR
uniref:Uncharacterized protein n=1 Tax=Neovison vison TaxID=452646 RepID=A0A8C7AKI4_NEOVI